MKTQLLLRIFLIFSLIIVNIGCDQVTKNIVRTKVPPYETITLISNHLTITNVENTGAFLSTGQSLSKPLKSIVLSLIPLLALAFGLTYVIRKQSLSGWTIIGLCCMIGGGIGNIFDRIIYGSVTDFLHIDFGIFQTGIFNMADLSIMTGAFIIILNKVRDRISDTKR